MLITWELFLILILIGFIVGALNTIAGAGGGVFFVSIMVLYMRMPFNVARDTSILVMVIGSFTAFVLHIKQNRVNLILTLTLSIFSILGSLACWIFLLLYPLSNLILRYIFGIIMIITACNFFLKIIWDRKNGNDVDKYCKDFEIDSQEFKRHLKRGIPFFILAGFIAHLLGIGGGVVNTPSCHLLLGLSIHTSTATSAGIMFFTAVFNVIIKILFGEINYLIGIILAIGVVFGGLLGAKISYKMPKIQLQLFVAIIMIFLGINMLLSL
ncbi:MAG: TSUP family transporter [Candidatus Lokiarchaeota archaeon]|nr:TSUP family transporter [Candidatus Lokiarchaeota archaeon]